MQVCSCARACRRGAPARWPSAARSPTTPRASAPSASWRRRSSGELTRVRRSWLSPHLLADAALGEADRGAAALGPSAHATLLAACDRLGESSTLLALRAYRHAAEAWRRFGPEGTARWLALGEAVATGEPACREGALAYFAVPPAALGGPDAAAAWCDLGRAVARVSRRLAAPFFERTAPVRGRLAPARPRRLPRTAAGDCEAARGRPRRAPPRPRAHRPAPRRLARRARAGHGRRARRGAARRAARGPRPGGGARGRAPRSRRRRPLRPAATLRGGRPGRGAPLVRGRHGGR